MHGAVPASRRAGASARRRRRAEPAPEGRAELAAAEDGSAERAAEGGSAELAAAEDGSTERAAEGGSAVVEAAAGGEGARTVATPSVAVVRGDGASDSPSLAAGATVVHVPLDRIVADEAKFMFRARLRFSDLAAHLAREGQQIPAVVRPVPGAGEPRYELISGFRRLHAARSLGWETLATLVREDLEDDEAAFRASVAENVARQSYSDIDRAIVIRSYRDRGYAAKEVADLMGMSERNRKLVLSLLDMPAVVKQAVDAPEHPFKTKHAVLLARLAARFPELDVAEWVERVGAERLSVDRMVRAVHKAHGKLPSAVGFTTLFQARGTDPAAGEFWLAPTKVRVAELDAEERERLVAELETLLGAVRARSGA